MGRPLRAGIRLLTRSLIAYTAGLGTGDVPSVAFPALGSALLFMPRLKTQYLDKDTLPRVLSNVFSKFFLCLSSRVRLPFNTCFIAKYMYLFYRYIYFAS